MVFIICLNLIFASTVFAHDPPPVLHSISSFTTLASYLEYHTRGAVKPVKESEINFNINFKRNDAKPNLVFSAPDLIHSLFQTDVHQYIRNAGAADFVSAKKKFYSEQKFDEKKQRFSRPYVYPTDWHSLNHNPIRKIDLPHGVYGKQFEAFPDSKILKSPLLEVELHRKLDELTNTEMTSGNKLRLLNNGQVSYKEKVRMVKESKNFLLAVVMVQYCDESNSEIIDAMMERARAGVDVRLMVENVWTEAILRKCVRKLKSAGVKVTQGKGFFNPDTLFSIHHSKFWIRDGEEAIMGGQNMHDLENFSNGFNHHTRDKDVHVTGPAVTDMMVQYFRIWDNERFKNDPSLKPWRAFASQKAKEERGQGLRGTELYETWINRDISDIPGVCRVLVQGSKLSNEAQIIPKAYIEIMKKTKFSMIINTPALRYYEKTNEPYNISNIIRTMLDADQRGVKIDLITNGVDGNWGEAGFHLRAIAQRLKARGMNFLSYVVEKMERALASHVSGKNYQHIAKILKGENVDVWTYFNHIHSKQMMFDQILTSTGSFNLDKYSHLSNESTMICLDKKLADESMKSFISDIINSTPSL